MRITRRPENVYVRFGCYNLKLKGFAYLEGDFVVYEFNSIFLLNFTAAIGAFREAYEKAKPAILEPIMKVSIEGPTEFQGNMFGLINQRRGVIVDSTDENNMSTVNAEVPLSEMFGFSTILRSSTQGKAEFTMEFLKYGKVPGNVSEELQAKYKAEKAAEKK